MYKNRFKNRAQLNSTSNKTRVELPNISLSPIHHSQKHRNLVESQSSALKTYSSLSLENNYQTPSSSLIGELSKAAKNNDCSQPRTPNCTCYMEQRIMAAGMNLRNPDGNELRVDEAIFVKELTASLISKPDELSKNVDQFVEDFKKFHSDSNILIKSLSESMTSPMCDVARGAVQSSLVRLLLQIEVLYPKISDYLLEKLSVLSIMPAEDDSSIPSIKWVRMLLQPFKFLNRVSDSKALCQRLCNIMIVVPDTMIQQEFITCLPDIICDNDHGYTSTELSKLLQNKVELIPSILDAFNNLLVPIEVKSQVREYIFHNTMRNAPLTYLPNAIKFLLSTTDADTGEVINSMRTSVQISSESQVIASQVSQSRFKPKSTSNTQTIVISVIRDCLLASKVLADIWLKIICNSEGARRPLDVIVLLILYDIATETSRMRSIETAFRNLVKKESINAQLFDETMKSHLTIVQQYFATLMAIASKMLKSVDPIVINFASSIYKICYKYMDGHWCRLLLTELLSYIGAGDSNHAKVALDTLRDVTRLHLRKIRPVATLLRVLFDKLGDFDLPEITQMMDVLCRVAFSKDDCAESALLEDEIDTLIRKQLSSVRGNMLRNGIVGAVMAMKHLAKRVRRNSTTTPNPSQIPSTGDNRQLQKAIALFDLVIAKTKSNPEARGLFYDKFSVVLMRSRLFDEAFLFRVNEVAKSSLSYYLSEASSVQPISDIESEKLFAIGNDPDNHPVALNLAARVAQELKNGRRGNMLIAHSLFRSIRALNQGDLHEIDALLECSVLSPTFAAMQDLDNLTRNQQEIVMDCLFHICNWFIEAVNCFSTFVNTENGDSVVIRLRTIIWLREAIARSLPQLISLDYCPPRCRFDVECKAPIRPLEKKAKKTQAEKSKGGKRKKGNDDSAESADNISLTSQSQARSAVRTPPETNGVDANCSASETIADLTKYKYFFRDLDPDVWILLTLELKLKPTPEKDGGFTPEFGPSELLYILEDCVEKLQSTITNNSKRRSYLKTANVVSNSLGEVTPLLVENIVNLLPKVCDHLEVISKYCQDLLKENDSCLDTIGMLRAEDRIIKGCFTLLVKWISILFGWESFRDSYPTQYAIAIKTISSRAVATVSQPDIVQSEISECVRYFASLKGKVLQLSCALHLVEVMDALCNQGTNEDLRKIIGRTCKDFLKHRWFDLNGCEEKGAEYNRIIEKLFEMYLRCTTDRIARLSLLSKMLTEEVAYFTNKDATLRSFPTISKNNFHVLIRVLYKELSQAMSEILADKAEETDKLKTLQEGMVISEEMVAIMKSQDSRINLAAFVKGSLLFLKSYETHGIPVCSALIRAEGDAVSQVFKRLQVTTRYIQSVCNHSKTTQDTALGVFLPRVRTTLESILLKVKRVLSTNGFKGTFFMGIMKNKDLKGREITNDSQASNEGSSSSPPDDVDELDMSEEEANPAEDEDMDVDEENLGDE